MKVYRLKKDKQLIIAIDGFSACGKSTLAQELAKELGYIYIDTGSMYRAVSLYFLEHGIDLDNAAEVKHALGNINIAYEIKEDSKHIFLNKRDVTQLIREMRINEIVSEVAAIPMVRREMVAQQQEMGKLGGIVMDGRDIGTVVFPFAELKVFLIADEKIRAQRRLDEFHEKGIQLNLNEIMENLHHRDHIDSTRDDSPLRKAMDAKELDNSHLDKAEQLQKVLNWVNEIKSKN